MSYKNSLNLFMAEGFSSLASALIGLMVARRLLVNDFGSFSAALAFAQIVSVLVDSGMGTLAARNISRQPIHGMAELDRLFTWRVLMIIGFTLFTPLISRVVLPTSKMREIAFILTPALMLLTMTDFVGWILKAIQRIQWYVILQVGSRSLLLLLCTVALFSRRQMSHLLAAYCAAGVAATILSLYILAKTAHVIRLTKLTRQFFVEVIPNVYMLGGIIILNVIFSRMDVMLVAKYCGSHQTGLYGAAARVMDGLRMMPTVALGICLPMFSAAHNEPARLRSQFLTAYEFLLLASMGLTLAGATLARPLFTYVLGAAYIDSAPLFRPLVLSGVFMYANMLLFALLYSLNDHRTSAIAVSVAITVNLLINFISLRYWGPIAASWSRVAAEGVLFAIQANGVSRKGVVTPYDLFFKPALMVGCGSIAVVLWPRIT